MQDWSGKPGSADRRFCRPRLSRGYYRRRAVFYRGVETPRAVHT